MSQAQDSITPTKSYPLSGTAMRLRSEPNANSKSAGMCAKYPAKKEARRLEKEAKVAAKAAKAVTTPAGERKVKEKATEEEVVPFVNTTPKGQKKDLSGPMAAGYDPIAVEAAWYDRWLEQGFFKPDLAPDGGPKPGGLFVISAPPPNVTGSLHIGHALTTAIQDALVRWYRMLGKTTLFVPGFDHAGISTQSVVEKRLFKTSGQTRHDLGRERFLETVTDWKIDYQERITNQVHRLGGSYDWSRVAFTMNPQLSKAVVENFCRLHEEGIIYRANRLVNWCVRLNTTLSNLEVSTKKQLEKRTFLGVPGYDPKEKFEFGAITSFAYPIENSDHARDTAIAVHPNDDRYKHLHGKFAVHPFVDRRIPIVTDDIVVDIAFGTGAVKITPAHDPNDYEVGIRHKLDFINILNDDGTLNANAGPHFHGRKRFHVRVEVVNRLKELGLYIETKDNPCKFLSAVSLAISLSLCSSQWWVDCKPLAEEAIKNIQDWCISRQLWWGHRCPAYFVRIEGKEQDSTDGRSWVVGRDLEEATERAKKLAGSSNFTLEQDEDVLDTWFSSALWPFSILGWPDKTTDFEKFYPTSILETGWDILFFWVARMAMLGLRLTGKMPFNEVLCHAMIRDARGRKMSKTLGNVIDPLDVIQGLSLEKLHEKLYEGNLDAAEIGKAELGQKKDFPKGIPQCGTDALRFALCAYSGGGRDINLEILRVEGYRKFCNKILNATKFVMLKLDETFRPEPTPKPTGNESLVERWILHKLNVATAETNKQLGERNFMAATNAVYNFWLYELCDVYIEAMKPMTDPSVPEQTRISAQQTLYTCLDHGLRLLHPFMPFVTEELWQRLSRRPNDARLSIMVSRYPVYETVFVFEEAERHFDLLFNAIRVGRSLAASYNPQSGIQNDSEAALFESQRGVITTLTKGCKSVEVVRDVGSVPPGCGSTVLTSTISVHILVRMAKIAKCEKKLQPPDYVETVPENVRSINEDRRKTLEAEVSTLESSKDMFAKLR
ncbi:hypothetical protein BJV74DRAFT_876641 [Russula compacta]|nr:hypothetical protein BJV74DRAFT_876641 [Russula compacta]